MSISEKLINVPQRENSGEEADSAFAFQKNWAFYKILKMHYSIPDYVVIFEYHDDILFLDSEIPTTITFTQIKKSDKKPWSIPNLTLIKKGQKLSILGKLFIHCDDFKDEIIFLKFVSDIHFSFCPNKVFYAKSSIKEKDKKTIFTRMKKQLVDFSESWYDRLEFEISEIKFENHEIYLLGEIERFITTNFDKNSSIRPTLIYDVFQRIGERSRRPSSRILSFQDLIINKGVTRREINEFFEAINKETETLVSWEDIKVFFQSETILPLQLLKLKGAYINLNNRIKLNSDNVIIKSVKDIKNIISQKHQPLNDHKLIKQKLLELSPEYSSLFTKDELDVLIYIVISVKILDSTKG
jgi:hypothetical protein